MKIKDEARPVYLDFVKLVSDGLDPMKAKDQAIENYQRNINPRRSMYTVGDYVELPNGTYEVIGYDKDGEPLVNRK